MEIKYANVLLKHISWKFLIPFIQRAREDISWRIFRGLCLYSINSAGDNECCRGDM